MQALAHRDILDWLVNYVRIRLAAQSPEQGRFTLALIEDGLNAEGAKFQGNPASASDQADQEVFLYQQAFAQLSAEVLAVMASGLTMEEATVTGPMPID